MTASPTPRRDSGCRRGTPRDDVAGPRNHLHAFRRASVDEVDDEVPRWLAEAYEVGMQRHLGR